MKDYGVQKERGVPKEICPKEYIKVPLHVKSYWTPATRLITDQPFQTASKKTLYVIDTTNCAPTVSILHFNTNVL